MLPPDWSICFAKMTGVDHRIEGKVRRKINMYILGLFTQQIIASIGSLNIIMLHFITAKNFKGIMPLGHYEGSVPIVCMSRHRDF